MSETLIEAKSILNDYAQKCSTVDEGNLYFAATQFESAYEQMKSDRQVLLEALQFYASHKSWLPFEDKCESDIFELDQSYVDDRPPMRSCVKVPGKKAREAIAKVNLTTKEEKNDNT